MARKLSARAWMAQLSTAGREPASEIRHPAPVLPPVLVTEQWDGERWISRRLVWDGTSYVPEVV